MSKYLIRPEAILVYDHQTKASMPFLLRRHAYRMLGASCDRYDAHADLQQVTAKIHPNDAGNFTAAFHEAVQGFCIVMLKAALISMAMNGAYTYLYSDAHLRKPCCALLTYADTRHYMDCALLYSIVEVIQDVTKIVLCQQEEERQEAMTAKLNAVLKAELKHKDEMHRLLRTISHEIRNPLHGILGNTQALLDLLLPLQQHATEAVNASSGACHASTSNSNSSGVNAREVYTDDAPHSASTPLADADGLWVVKRRSISALRFLSKASRYCTSGSDRQLLGRPQSLLQAGSRSSNSSAHTMPQRASVSAASGTGVGRASSTSSSEAAPAGCSALKTATSMVSEIHECALHQASVINVSAQIAFVSSLRFVLAGMLELQDLLDLEILKGTRATPELSLIDIDAAVQSVVKMFKISIQNK
eukprot:20602-Heterococcus_DN1.PRE.1